MLGPSYCMHDLFIFSKLKHATDVATAFLTAYAPHVFFHLAKGFKIRGRPTVRLSISYVGQVFQMHCLACLIRQKIQFQMCGQHLQL